MVPASPRPPASFAWSRRRFLGGLAAGCVAWSVGRAALAAPSRATGLVLDEVCKCHVTPAGKPERPARYDAALQALVDGGYYAGMKVIAPRPAGDEALLACHTPAYLALVEREVDSGRAKLSTGDTFVCPQSLVAARWAAGAACTGVDAVVGGTVQNAFCLMRPPGHHATADRGMGFCVFNNAAVAARHAQRRHGIGKVLVVDWDCHHGNGTQEIFYEDPSVLFFSVHQSPWYPWTGSRDETGRGRGRGATLNCPLPAGSGRKEFLSAFLDALAPAVDRFRPELVVLSAGFDARKGDPLGRLELADPDYRELTAIVLEMARTHAGGRLVSVMEGGYSLEGLAAAAAAHCAGLQAG